jgi:hypothetical protein
MARRAPDPAPGLEIDGRYPIGRDPREMTRVELEALVHGKKPLLRVIRARCLDCCCYQESEVRKCTAVRCANWPYRMATDPFSDRKGNPDLGRTRRQASAIQSFGDDEAAAGTHEPEEVADATATL